MSTQHDDASAYAWFKLALAWFGALLGSITLQHIVLFATLVFTVLQIYVLIRDKILRREH